MNANVLQSDELTFDSIVLQATEPVLVDFWGPMCPPCDLIAPHIEDLASHYQGRLRVVKVNADDSPDLVERCGIMAKPTLLFFKQGREVHRLVGAWPKTKLTATVEKVLATPVS